LKDGEILLGGLKEHLKTIRRSRRVVFIGCGTSYNAALAARPFVEELTGKSNNGFLHLLCWCGNFRHYQFS
jgi:glucosamine 6-phosphate synthetase-like amidotransferase/phosphosugar isomerase protein